MAQSKFDKKLCTESELRDRIERSTNMARQMESEDRDSAADLIQIERLRRHAAVCRDELTSRGLS